MKKAAYKGNISVLKQAQIISSLLIIYLANTVIANDQGQLKNGYSEGEIIALLGEPPSIIEAGSKKILYYDSIKIEIVNGRAINLPSNFEQSYQRKKREKEDLQKLKKENAKKGLILYDGKWMTPAEKKEIIERRLESQQQRLYNQRLKEKNSRDRKVQQQKDHSVTFQTSHGGAIDYSDYVKGGRITVLAFYTNTTKWRKLEPVLDKYAFKHREVSLVKVVCSSQIKENFGVFSTPHIRIFDYDKRCMRAVDSFWLDDYSAEQLDEHVQYCKEAKYNKGFYE